MKLSLVFCIIALSFVSVLVTVTGNNETLLSRGLRNANPMSLGNAKEIKHQKKRKNVSKGKGLRKRKTKTGKEKSGRKRKSQARTTRLKTTGN